MLRVAEGGGFFSSFLPCIERDAKALSNLNEKYRHFEG